MTLCYTLPSVVVVVVDVVDTTVVGGGANASVKWLNFQPSNVLVH